MRFPDVKVFDNMVKANSILIGFSLFLMVVFVSYGMDWFGFQEWYSHTAFFESLVNSSYIDYLPLLIIITPLIGSFIELNYSKISMRIRDRVVIYTCLISLVFVVLMYPVILEGPISFEIPGILELGISFRIDMLGYIVLLLSSFIWFYVSVYAHTYMEHEQHSTRFFFFLGVTYSSVVGAIVSGDLLTMFLFFEVMTLSSYMLVIHGQDDACYKAGYNYMIMGLIGGFLIFVAIILMYFNMGSLSFVSAIQRFEELGSLKYWIMGLIVFGFGIKAGMAPVHVWLPRAHPVAPSPASAILSGVMIKIGAFGILRVATSYYFPIKGSTTGSGDPIWMFSETVGAIVIWTGIVTMTIGVFMALQQSNMKKMLAYHSVSQMGYIIMGIGVALYLGYKGAMGYTGAIYHIINHALFKSILFMVAGVVYWHTRELNMYKLGGLWKKLPITTIVFIIAALGISGVPLFNGYVSKTILHHSIVEAYEYGSGVFFYAEIIFMIVSAGTAASFIKMFYYVFMRKTDNTYPYATFDFSSFDIALWAMAIFVILIGIFPTFIIDSLILKQLDTMAYSASFIDKHIAHIHIFTVEDIGMTGLVLLGGFLIFLFGKKFDLFHLKLPKWLNIEYWLFLPGYVVMRNLCKWMYGDKCPIDQVEFRILAEADTNKIGFIERFVLTSKILNRRYEQSIIRKDALIYSFIVTGVLAYLVISQLVA